MVTLNFSFCLACLVCVLSDSAFAQSLTLAVNKPTAQVGDEVQITIDSNQSLTYCGIHVEYAGSNETPTFIRVGNENLKLPYTFKKTFNAPGTIQIKAFGARVSSALGCPGKANATLVISAPIPIVAPPNPVNDIIVKARSGDMDAAYSLANALANGGQDQEAFTWFDTAAKSGHVKAMNSLGFMYEEGRGTLQDHKEAAEWYRKAMMKGNPDAMINRGVLLFKGLGVPANKSQAYINFSLGATYATDTALRGEAIKLRDDTAKQMTAAQITTAQAYAKKLALQIK